ncbi:MAG: hypothetical protein KKD74_07220 [Bacteroidetes bacterium]|nr:hypothetical protein [Bacteroidota bacterium]
MKTFSKVLCVLIVAGLSLGTSTGLVAQSEKELKKEVNQKALKEARKEAKKLDKEGYKVNPGQMPLAKQLEASWMMQYEVDAKGEKKYYMADASSVGETQAAAKLQAYELAKINMVGQISSEVAGRVKNNIGNQQLSTDDAASITQTMGEFQSKYTQKLGRVKTAFEAWRIVNKKVEVRVLLAYSTEEAMKLAKDLIREDLKKLTTMDDQKISKVLQF